MISKVFDRYRADFRKLEAFGFREKNGILSYSEALPDEQFLAVLEVSEDGTVSGRVMDLDTGEEYMPIRVRNQIGGFVGGIREQFTGFLEHVREECFVPVSFICDQSNRIESSIHRAYHVTAEFPWEKYPGNGTFKCARNEKWFALVLTVEFGKLDGAKDQTGLSTHDEDEIVEVLNLKSDPEEIGELTKRPGIFPAWHMNKKHWLSVILDGTLPDEEVMALVNRSYQLVSEGQGSFVRGTGAWMIPSNPKVYDVDAGFRDGDGVIEWHQHNRIEPGDEVYIYCSAPFSAILYRCRVLEADLHYHGMFLESKGYSRAMRIRLIEKYPPEKFPLSFIREHGGSVVRSARSMPEELYEAIRAEQGRKTSPEEK